MILGKLFGGKRNHEFPAASLGTDIHSHLVPGIDDGAKTIEDSIDIIQGLIRLGYKKVITTPHIIADTYPNTHEIIQSGYEKLKAALVMAEIPIEIEVAAEYYIDEGFEKLLDSGPLLTFGGANRYILFETSYMYRPLVLETIIFKLHTAGYKPVFAHPERYHYFWDNDGLDLIREIAEMNVLLQLNIGSLAGSYDVRAGKIAKQLLKHNLIDFAGTDVHRTLQLSRLPKAFADSDFSEQMKNKRFLNHTL